MSVTWLGWDGHCLRWRYDALSIAKDFELRLDGTTFQRFSAQAHGAKEFACDFAFSPSGRDPLEFSLIAKDETIGARAWRVTFGRRADVGMDAWTHRAPGLAPLQGSAALPGVGIEALPRVAIVVPIYDSADAVRRCIDALLRWSPGYARLIFIDDASTQPAVAALLHATGLLSHVRTVRNAQNRGYTYSCNLGMKIAEDADVVLLNSDTEVGPRWLQSLQLAAYSAGDVATVTAVSDNAGAFSVPELERHCPIPARWNLVETQRAVLQQAGRHFPALPTGNGFCMYVKRSVIERIGGLDEAAFPEGYGEENDFCQRAARVGLRHLIAGNVLVHHQRSASFGDARRAALGLQGMAVLRERYPDYETQVGATLHSFERRVLDYRVRRVYADADATYAQCTPRLRLLLVSDVDPATLAADAQVSASIVAGACDEQDVLILCRSDTRLELLQRDAKAAWQIIATHAADDEDLAGWLRTCLADYAIESIRAPGSDALSTLLAGIAVEQQVDVMKLDR